MIFCKVVDCELSVDEALKFARKPGCGAVSIFAGTVRDNNEGKSVVSVSYSAFAEMAEKEMEKIAREVVEKWRAGAVYMIHRVGKLNIGDASVIIAVSTPHRRGSFEACEYAIDKLKQTVPIWKEEFYAQGQKWVT